MTPHALPRPTHVGDYDHDGVEDRMVSFPRGRLRPLLRCESGPVALTVSGLLTTGEEFSGSDTVTVIGRDCGPGGDDDEDDQDDEDDDGDDEGDEDDEDDDGDDD